MKWLVLVRAVRGCLCYVIPNIDLCFIHGCGPRIVMPKHIMLM